MPRSSTRAPWATCIAVIGLQMALPTATADENAAHRLADAFAGSDKGAADGGAAAGAHLTARDERARRAAEAARRAFEARREARRRRSDEADMLARARAEAAARAEEARRAEAARLTAEELRLAREAEQRKRAQETQRADDARELSEKLRRTRDADIERVVREAEEKTQARHAEHPPAPPEFEAAPETVVPDQPLYRALRPPAPRDPVASMGPPPSDPRGDDDSDTRVTVLLVLQPGSRGIRRWNKTADPLLCLGETCYVSTGADSTATALTRTKAFGPGVALGSRAGACRNSLGCVFRAVRLDSRGAPLQPVDLRVLRHDRREIRRAAADETCQVVRGTLTCRAPVRADSYRAWIVPEDLAEVAGAEALAAAVAQGLPDEVSSRD